MITILLFAQLQEVVGQDRLELDIGPITVADFKKEFKQKYNALQIDETMVAVNEVYVRNDDLINPGDTVALIPPISGG